MSATLMLGFVLLAVYALTSLLISTAVQILWPAHLDRARLASGGLLVLRLLPLGGAILITLGAVLPAFLIYEPVHEAEKFGPLLLALALLSLATFGDAVRRGWRACSVARAVVRSCGSSHCRIVAGQRIHIVDVAEPIVAIVGGWRPRMIATRSLLAECSQEELCQIIAHEAAHLSARDNLKLLLLLMSPDVLTWLPAGRALTARWRAAAELEADERATGSDRHKRLALASALVKVARLSFCARGRLPSLSLSVAVDDVESRVRQLLRPRLKAPATMLVKTVAMGTILIPVLAIPFLASSSSSSRLWSHSGADQASGSHAKLVGT